MVLFKRESGAGILQPAQGDNINKEGQTETSVGGGGKETEGEGEGEGLLDRSPIGGNIYRCGLIQPDYRDQSDQRTIISLPIF